MIKVLNIITDKNIGGAGLALTNFLKSANREEFEHTVLLPPEAMLAPRLRALGINVVEVPGVEDKSFDIHAIKVFKEQIKHFDPDIVHTHASLSARIAARKIKTCAVVHTRHCAYRQSKLKTSFPIKQMLGFINNRYSDIIIAVSPSARDTLIVTGTKPEKIVTMFNGVEAVRKLEEHEKLSVRNSLGIAPDDFVCAVVARLVPEKGHEYILDAASQLLDIPIVFLIVGSGPIEGHLRETAEKLQLKNCIFTGFIEDVAEIENIADIQINASIETETSSLSLLESMSLGIPAVVTDIGGNPYLINDGVNGLVVPAKSGQALAEAVRKLYSSAEILSEMGKSAHEIYNQKYTAAVMAANIEQVYRNVCKNKNN